MTVMSHIIVFLIVEHGFVGHPGFEPLKKARPSWKNEGVTGEGPRTGNRATDATESNHICGAAS